MNSALVEALRFAEGYESAVILALKLALIRILQQPVVPVTRQPALEPVCGVPALMVAAKGCKADAATGVGTAAARVLQLLLGAAEDHLAAAAALVDAAAALIRPAGDGPEKCWKECGLGLSGSADGSGACSRATAGLGSEEFMLQLLSVNSKCNAAATSSACAVAAAKDAPNVTAAASKAKSKEACLTWEACPSPESRKMGEGSVGGSGEWWHREEGFVAVDNLNGSDATATAAPASVLTELMETQGGGRLCITSQIVFQNPIGLCLSSTTPLAGANGLGANGAGPGCRLAAAPRLPSTAAEQEAAAEASSSSSGFDHEDGDVGPGTEALQRLQSAASALLDGDECLDWARSWVLDLLLPPPSAAASLSASHHSTGREKEAVASALRTAAGGLACVPRNDQIRVARLAAADSGGASGGMERWAAEVLESADLGPHVPRAAQLAAALVEAGRSGRLLELLPGCRITDCRPLLLDSE